MSGGTAGSLQGPFNYCVCSRNQPAWGLPLRQWGGSGPAHAVSGGRGSQESGTSCDLASWTKVVHHLVRLRADSAGTPERAGPAAFRSLSRPSSALGAKASSLRSFSLDLLKWFPFFDCAPGVLPPVR